MKIVYTIAYTSFNINKFIEVLKKYKITCIIDIRSIPKSSYNKDFDDVNLIPILKNNGILYRNYKEEFEITQDSDNNVQNSNVISNLHQFNNGIEKIIKANDMGFVVSLMRAEKEPFNCYKTSLITESLSRSEFRVNHILENGEICKEEFNEISIFNSPFVNFNLVVKTQQTPGEVLFENYEQLKASITKGITFYNEFEYNLDNYKIALSHHDELKYIKNILEKTKRELIKNYNTPLEIVEKKLDELINLIKVPFKKVDTFIKENEKNSKKYEIYIFAKNVAISKGLQEHMDYIFRSPAFFDSKWLNASCSKFVWKSAVISKLENSANDISYILSIESENKPSILAHYYQTLSMEKVEEFINALTKSYNITEKTSNINNLNLDSVEIKQSENVNLNTSNENLDLASLKDSEIIKCVAKSINPYTGEVITGIDDLLKSRLNDISLKLDNLFIEVRKSKIKNSDYLMAGQKWSQEEDLKLIEEFKMGLSISEISLIHSRKKGAIRKRLKKHNLMD